MENFLKRLAPILLIAAVVLFTYLGVDEWNAQKNYAKTTGIITDITVDYATSSENNDYHVMVRYSADGEEYESELGSYDATMHIGKEISVIYDPANPREVRAAGFLGYAMYFGMAALALFGAVISLKEKRKQCEAAVTDYDEGRTDL